jgi:hypothetical protein
MIFRAKDKLVFGGRYPVTIFYSSYVLLYSHFLVSVKSCTLDLHLMQVKQTVLRHSLVVVHWYMFSS